MPDLVPRKSTASYSAESIKGYIRRNGLVPGSPLPTESALCEELGVSRSAVREAIRTLAALDIVEVRHGYGTYVGGLSLSPLVSGLVFRGSLNHGGDFRTLREVVRLRIALDLGVADELAGLYVGTTNSELRALVDGMRDRNDRGETFTEQDGAFHRQLFGPLNNELYRQLMDAFWEIHTSVVPLLSIPTADNMRRTVNAHDEILDALEKGDATGYGAAVARHFEPLQHAIDEASRQHR